MLTPEHLGISVASCWKIVGSVITTVLFSTEKEGQRYLLCLDTGLGDTGCGLFGPDYPFTGASVAKQAGQETEEVPITVERALCFLRLENPELECLFNEEGVTRSGGKVRRNKPSRS